MSDFFDSTYGQLMVPPVRRLNRLMDFALDLGLVLSGGRRRMRLQAASIPRRRILILGVSVPGRLADMDRVVARLSDTRHDVTVSTTPMADAGKFENLTTALEKVGEPACNFDWVILTDDDIALPAGFTDDFIGLAEMGGLTMAQPAHRRFSHATFAVTRRQWGALVRRTQFVEIGPVTAIRGDVVNALLPFPKSRWAWGLDVLWAQTARDRNWPVGVVDGAPVEHLRPVAGAYDSSLARQEARDFLTRHGVTIGREECFGETTTVSWWPGLTPSTAPATAAPRRGADAALR
jgi:hypothetical protein